MPKLLLAGESLFLQAQKILPPQGQSRSGQFMIDNKDVALFNLESTVDGFIFKSFGPKLSLIYRYDRKDHKVTLVNPAGKDVQIKTPAKTLKAYPFVELLMGSDSPMLKQSFKEIQEITLNHSTRRINRFESTESVLQSIEFQYLRGSVDPSLKTLKMISDGSELQFDFD